MHEEVDYSEKLVFSDEEGNNSEKISRSTPNSRSSKADSGKNVDEELNRSSPRQAWTGGSSEFSGNDSRPGSGQQSWKNMHRGLYNEDSSERLNNNKLGIYQQQRMPPQGQNYPSSTASVSSYSGGYNHVRPRPSSIINKDGSDGGVGRQSEKEEAVIRAKKRREEEERRMEME